MRPFSAEPDEEKKWKPGYILVHDAGLAWSKAGVSVDKIRQTMRGTHDARTPA
jgi:hypothetical protein